MAAILALSVYLINVGYGFEGTFDRLGDLPFTSAALSDEVDSPGDVPRVNRFSGAWLGSLPLPLPRNYVLGIDVQRRDFENKCWSYLAGEWRFGGWWYYYLYALAIKVPLGTWALLAMATGASVLARSYSPSWGNEIILLTPAAVVLALVSSQTGFNHHMRYVLPIFPFVFIWISKLARGAAKAASFGVPDLRRGFVVRCEPPMDLPAYAFVLQRDRRRADGRARASTRRQHRLGSGSALPEGMARKTPGGRTGRPGLFLADLAC